MNCLRSLKFIQKLNKKYKKHGLKTLIVHPPEWKFEKDSANISEAIKKNRIKIPIIIDKNKSLIKKFGINFWPAQILVSDSKVVYKHVGEGSYRTLEKHIIRFLKIEKQQMIFAREPIYSKYPAIYLGKKKCGKIKKIENKLKSGIVYISGKWIQKEEHLENRGKDCNLTLLTEGKIIHFVARSFSKSAKIAIRLNNRFIKSLTIGKPQLYNVIKLKGNVQKKLTLTTNSKIAVYSFSFQ